MTCGPFPWEEDPFDDDLTKWEPMKVLDLGSEVLGMRVEDGVLIVTTARGTFPLDPRLFDG